MTRNVYFDQLRIIGAIAVVFLHAAAPTSSHHGLVPFSDWIFATFISTLTHWSVPVFVMISGALALSPSSPDLAHQKYFQKRLFRLALPLIAWVSIYAVAHHLWRGDPLSLEFTLKRFVFDQPYEHLFFLVVMLELAAITPFLKRLLSQLTASSQLFLTLLFTFIAIFWKPTRFILPLGVPYLSYFLLGHYLTQFPIKVKWPKIIILSLGTLVTGFTWIMSHYPSATRDGLYWYTFFSPTMFILSVIVFGWGTQTQVFRTSKVWIKLSKLSYGVYLIHPLIMTILNTNYSYSTLSHPLEILSFGWVILILSTATTLVISRLPFLKHLV